MENQDLVALFYQVCAYLIPSERSTAADEEWLAGLCEEDLTGHAEAVTKVGYEIWGDVGHGWVGIGVEDGVGDFDGAWNDQESAESSRKGK